MKQDFNAGSKVKLKTETAIPLWCECDDDKGRVSAHVKKKIKEKFFKCDKKLTCEVMHISKESERDKLRKSGRTKVRVRTPAGETIIIPVETDKLEKA